MQALAFAIKLLRAIWGAIGGAVTLVGLYFLLVPLTLVGGIALGGLALILLVLVLLKQRIRISMVVVGVLIAAVCTLAAPFAIPGRIYVVRCEKVSLDCALPREVSLGETTATIFPVADPIKEAVLSAISPTRPRFRILPTTRTPEGLYLVHAPLERVLADLSAEPSSGGSLATISLPGLLSEFSLDLYFESGSNDIGTELAFATGFSPNAYSFTVSRFDTSPGFFGAYAQHPTGMAQWREAVRGDLMIEELLKQDFASLNQALAAPDPGESQRAALRRALIRLRLNPSALSGTVFHLQSLMESRALLAGHRNAIDTLRPDDPMHYSAMNLISWPLFLTPPADGSEMEKAVFRAQHDYYRALFAEEFRWATAALPQALNNQRLYERLDAIDEEVEERELLNIAERYELRPDDPEISAEALDAVFRAMFGGTDQSSEEREFVALLKAENYDEINRRIGATAPEARARALWRIMAYMEREALLGSSGLMLAAVQGGNLDAFSTETATPVARWQALLREWTQHETPLVRQVLETRVDKLSLATGMWDAMRELVAKAPRDGELSSDAAVEAIEQAFARFAELDRDQWLLPTLLELSPSFEQSPRQQIAALQSAIVRRCAVAETPANQFAMLGFLLLETRSRTPGVALDRQMLDCMWSRFGPEGSQGAYWQGVVTTRGLFLIADDARLLELNRDLLSHVGGDPPWMLVILQSLGRPQDVLNDDLGPRAREWERLAARYARRPGARASPTRPQAPTPQPEAPPHLYIPPPRY